MIQILINPKNITYNSSLCLVIRAFVWTPGRSAGITRDGGAACGGEEKRYIGKTKLFGKSEVEKKSTLIPVNLIFT